MEDSRSAVRPQGSTEASSLLGEAALSPQRRPSCFGCFRHANALVCMRALCSCRTNVGPTCLTLSRVLSGTTAVPAPSGEGRAPQGSAPELLIRFTFKRISCESSRLTLSLGHNRRVGSFSWQHKH